MSNRNFKTQNTSPKSLIFCLRPQDTAFFCPLSLSLSRSLALSHIYLCIDEASSGPHQSQPSHRGEEAPVPEAMLKRLNAHHQLAQTIEASVV